ncbi:hypothetical protein ER308_07085 [Egibacter rhizosphaerae]|uniref:Large polyvalent protein associated domain-containing protein n=1 Tax=Egibacter rhizosphaerae TaxID=1670831 RepID=A0A411YDS4_9ACTN|nr:LPD29 domain-containing protein [Egibacter rhizosphaerae]QBI19330.1 hypothetical protein ER308_07085 [Egibacter rhizosphaerae]
MTHRRYLAPTETAKLLRKHLRATFPSAKFSVRTSKYAGGASLRVSWTDGPTDDEVRAATSLYEGADFDGMTDCKHYRDSILAHQDGTVEAVHHGADFIFTHRQLSPEFVRAAKDFIAHQGRQVIGGNGIGCYGRGCAARGFDDPGWGARGRDGERVWACSIECAAEIEIRNGQIRPTNKEVMRSAS